LDKKHEHIKTKNNLAYSIGDLVCFRTDAVDLRDVDKKKVWIVKGYVNEDPEECSIYDYVLTDAAEELVAIEFELVKVVKDERCK
jgi:hypothetical protein